MITSLKMGSLNEVIVRTILDRRQHRFVRWVLSAQPYSDTSAETGHFHVPRLPRLCGCLISLYRGWQQYENESTAK